MKKIITKSILMSCFLLFTMAVGVQQINAQCFASFSFGSATAPVVENDPVTLTTCAFTNEYSTVFNAQAGSLYELTATGSLGDVYVTVTQGTPTGTVLGHGWTTVQVTPTVTGNLYMHYHSDEFCNTASVSCVTGTVTLLPASAQCDYDLPGNITVNNDPGQCGAVVNFSVGQGDCQDPPNPIPPAGSFFPVGETEVVVGSGTPSQTSFSVTVIDTEEPQLVCPDDIFVTLSPGACEAPVFYDVFLDSNCPLLIGGIQSDFTGPYDVANWEIGPLGPGASVDVSNAPESITLIGPDGGFGCPPTVVSIEIGQDDTELSFDWEFNTVDAAFWDPPGYSVNGVFTQVLAGFVQFGTGSVSLVLQEGDIFAFEQQTLDCFGGPGILTISNFEATGFVAAEPYQVEGDPSGSFFGIGTHFIEWEIEDGEGGFLNCDFNINVQEFPNPTPVLVCNDLVNVSVDQNCEALLNADMILEGGPYGCYDNYELVIETTNGVIVGNPVGADYVGQVIMVTVIDPNTGNSCWGNIKIEDKIKPEIVCRDIEISCNDEIPNEPAPEVFDPQDLEQETPFNNFWTGYAFNLDNEGSAPIQIEGMEIQAALAGSPAGTYNIRIFMRDGTFEGNLNDDTGWVEVGNEDVEITAGFPTVSLYEIFFDNPYLIQPGGKSGVAVYANNGNGFGVRVVGEIGTAPTSDGILTINNNPARWLVPVGANGFWTGEAFPGENPRPQLKVFYAVTLDQIIPSDNCGPVEVDFTESVELGDCDDDFQAVITRNWTVTDLSGNQENCVQTISIERGDLNNYEAPENIVLECSDNFELDENENPHPSVSGNPVIEECKNIVGTYTDIRIEGNCGDYKILRNWTLLDWCTLDLVEFEQLIKVENSEDPIIVCPNDQTVSTSFNDCEGTFDILANPPLELSDACSDNLTYTVSSDAGVIVDEIVFGVRFWTIQNLPVGTHEVTYTANDGCDNFSSCTFDVTVVDDVAPIALCDLETVVSLGSDGNASVHVSAWDDGSYDNCGILDITARRKQQTRCDERNDWRPSINFCCEDLANSPIEIEVRVRDVNWQFVPPPATNPNENICWVTVIVEDKLSPIVSCPPDVTVNCAFDLDLDDLDNQFGRISRVQEGEERRTLEIDPVDLAVPVQIPVQVIQDGVAIDNCGPLEISENPVLTLNPQCGNVGTDPNPLFPFRAIQRRFVVSDGAGNTSSCQQDIYIRSNTRAFNGDQDWPQGDIRWPGDVTLSGCGTDPGDYEPDNLPVAEQDRRPFTRDVACSKPAMSYQDQVFTLVDSACFKILRTWKVIDWCQHDPNSGAGEWSHVQVIYIQDTQAPICNNCEDGQQFVDDESSDCTGSTPLILDVTDCTPDELLEVSWQIDAFNTGSFDISGTGLDASGDYPIGIHRVRWEVYDLCSNSAVFEYTFEVVDGKIPTPVCLNGIATVVMPVSGEITIPASFFDAASFDNCTANEDLIFSYSSDVEETTRTWTCDELDGNQEETFEVAIWVTDEAGNQDFCITYILIQDNMGVCPDTAGGTASISGWIVNEEDLPVENVEVRINATDGAIASNFVTGNAGEFSFNVPVGFNYELSGERTDNPLNGVTTYDIALIQRHILGTQYLDNPYKLIAADVNNDGNINVLDIAQLRRLILGTYDEFPNNDSWKVIVDEPLEMGVNPPAHQTTLDMGYVIRDMEENNFVAIKIGDVNASHNASGFAGSSERNLSEDLRLIAADQQFTAAEQVVVEITSDNIEGVFGYQGTINFDAQALEFAGFESGVIALEDANFGFHLLSNGMITTSWSCVEAISGAEGAVLFSLVFEARAEGILSESVSFGSARTAAESYNERGVMGVEMVFAGQQRENNFALYQNTPNPFNGETTIGFVLPEANEATLTIFDVTGKVVRVISDEYAAGYNEIRLDRSAVGAAGVYYYQLDTENHTATKKMIFMD